MESILITAGVVVSFAILGLLSFRKLIHICAPNEVLIFSGGHYKTTEGTLGYRLIKGGRGFRIPLLERVERLDLTNMIIDVTARNAYSRGGIPLTVQGVANVKIAGHEPVMNHAIERFLGKPRDEVMQIAKATLEGSLRGILATMTPEEVNEDRLLFAERLVQDVEHDMTALGLVVDTLKIQNVHDDVNYLDSIGRKKNAEILRRARIAEASAKADAIVNAAENRLREVQAQVAAKTHVAKANADKRLADAESRREALVAEERATIAGQLAEAEAGIEVERARVGQVKQRLAADVVTPAKAALQSAEARARADASPIVADGEARAQVLEILAASWRNAGPNARQIFLLQKLDKVVAAMSDVIGETPIEQLTMIDSRGQSGGSIPLKALSGLEQVKQLFGIDVVDRLQSLGRANQASDASPEAPPPVVRTAPRVTDGPQVEPTPDGVL